MNILEDVCRVLGRRLEKGPTETSRPGIRYDPSNSFLVYRNATPRSCDPSMGPLRGFHIIRDPRDVVVSAYFSHLHSHPQNPTFVEIRNTLQKLDMRDGLLFEFDYLSQQFEAMFAWDYRQSNVLEMRLESFSAGFYENWLRIFDFLDILDRSDSPYGRGDTFGEPQSFFSARSEHTRPNTLAQRVTYGLRSTYDTARTRLKRPWHEAGPAQRLAMTAADQLRDFGRRLRTSRDTARSRLMRTWCEARAHRQLSMSTALHILYSNRFAAKTRGREIGEEDLHHHYREGATGDWRNYFEPIHIADFKRRYNDGLLALGYETDPDWQP